LINLLELKPFVIKNVLSEEEYSYVYDCVNKGFPEEIKPDLPSDNREYPEYLNVPDLGYLAYIKGFSEDFKKSIKNTLENSLGIPLSLPDIHFARYTSKTGHKPTLKPHYDIGVRHPSVTISIQMDTTLDWDLHAYDGSATLSKNEAMVFSGSHQVHWRPPKDFSEDDYFDIMVCQLAVSDEILSEDHAEYMSIINAAAGADYSARYM